MKDKVLYYPNNLAGGHRMLYYARELNLDWTNDPQEDGITRVHYYAYENETLHIPKEIAHYDNIINCKCLNIKKDYIDDKFKEVFGYSIRIDPTTHRGMCVKKTTQNAVHNAKIIECPIGAHLVDVLPRYSMSGTEHTVMYQKMIDTRRSNLEIRDFRFVVMGYQPVFLFEKLMDTQSFSHVKKDGFLRTYGYQPSQFNMFFAEDEINKIKEFIIRCGYDFVEIDVLRDNSTGLIYIIDANPVPGGGIFQSMHDGEYTIEYLSNKYKETYLRDAH